jgi:hypothetical protein
MDSRASPHVSGPGAGAGCTPMAVTGTTVSCASPDLTAPSRESDRPPATRRKDAPSREARSLALDIDAATQP